ncbi:FimV/HubP family polar landmark protein [Tepidimonas alkaliphilus]|uniref:FimV/HubP family polar landmark protein n=1 Tax=Tepidimonas alkaliphilus TaxID=2588942 RepID=UPI00117C0A19|nr:FimV/HubP family polar landmark protein [Tepidimonas alkaliphilus]
MSPRARWRQVAAIAALSAALSASEAWALALGRVSVQSQLGEPLRAEIELPALTEEEAATLRVELADPARYRSANLDPAPWLRDITLQLQRRPDGRAIIEVRSERRISEPFVDLIVVARWAGGELLRGYTLLLEPPSARAPAPVTPLLEPAVPAPPQAAAPPTAVAPSDPQTSADPASSQSPARRAGTARAQADHGSAASSAAPTRIVVRPGDTAGRIAQRHRPEGVTLEQMLVALLRANPDAFIRGNVHLIKAGAVIDVPDTADVGRIDAAEARALVAAQTRDFNAYRRRLAAAAPAQHTAAPQRQAQGKVEAAVADAAPQASAQDKLTLSKAERDAQEAQRLAIERQQQEQQQRAAELERNLRELEQLRAQAQATAPSEPPSAETGASASTATEVTGDAAPQVGQDASPAQPADVGANAPTPAVSAPLPPQPSEPSGPVEAWLRHPWALPAAGGALALLAGLAWWGLRRRRSSQTAPAMPAAEPTPQPTPEPASESADSPADDDRLDPVAEAQLLLAHGREAQAQDRLREALAVQPHRLDARLKLLELLARRGDAAAFETEARALQPLCTADSPEWQRTCELGRELDPDNPLYRSTSAPATAAVGAAMVAAGVAATGLSSAADEPPTLDAPLEAASSWSAPASTSFETAAASDPAAASEPASPEQPGPTEGDDLALELDWPEDDGQSVSEATAQAPSPAGLPPEVAELSLDLPLDDGQEAAAPAAAMPEDASAGAPAAPDRDPLETKLSLAREFEAIGDIDGARILAEEVLAEAQGELRERAQAFLAQLG